MPRLQQETCSPSKRSLDVAFYVGEHPVRSGDTSPERQRIPQPYLEQVLQHLVRTTAS